MLTKGRPNWRRWRGLASTLVANGQPNAWIMSPTTASWARRLKSTSSYLLSHPELEKLDRYTTNQIADGEVYFGSFPEVIVGMHGGSIEVESTLGEGTAVTVRLPILC